MTITQIATRRCRHCKTEIPPTGKRGRPAVLCSDCKGVSKAKQLAQTVRRFQGQLPNGQVVMLVAGPEFCRLSVKNRDGSGAWSTAVDLERDNDAAWIGRLDSGLTIRVTVYSSHLTVRLTPPTQQLRFELVGA